jgi:hypothetical protein
MVSSDIPVQYLSHISHRDLVNHAVTFEQDGFERINLYYVHDHVVVTMGKIQSHTARQEPMKGMPFSKSQDRILPALEGQIPPAVLGPAGPGAMSRESK